jgi:hypothetical protein
MGDFAFCDYTWTSEEQAAFWKTGSPPRTVSSLPAGTPLVPIYHYARDLECSFQGPNVTSPQFRRLNASSAGRLIIWDLWGADAAGRSCPLAVVPSEEISPTKAQRSRFAENLMVDKTVDYTTRNPLVSSLLGSCEPLSSYTVGGGGPLLYENDGCDWAAVHGLLSAFATSLQPVMHPPGCPRTPARYRSSLTSLHLCLVEEFDNADTF